MRTRLIALALASVPFAAEAKERATFLSAGQYATTEQCEKLRAVEAGGPNNVGTAPELLTADGFHGWEGGCEFTKVFDHDPGKSWTAIMLCSEGMSSRPALYHFVKDVKEDRFEVTGPDSDDEGSAAYLRCDAKKEN